jgi:hypothetical protein
VKSRAIVFALAASGLTLLSALAPACGESPATPGTDASLGHDGSRDAAAETGPDSVSDAAERDEGADAARSFAPVLTQHMDNARTGANLSETILSPGLLDGGFREIGQATVTDQIYAQPLVLPNVPTSAGPRDLLLVATVANQVYAFDATNVGAAPLWQVGKGNELGTPDVTSYNVSGNNGILSTPVVDPTTWTIYLVARSCTLPSGIRTCAEKLFALDARSGGILQSVAISGSVPSVSSSGDGGAGDAGEGGAGDAGSAEGGVAFDPLAQWSRAGLLLASGKVFVGFAPGPTGDDHEESFVYHGWVLGYDATDFTAAPSVYCTTTNGRGGGVWQAGNGLATDGTALFFSTGNGIHGFTTYPPSSFPPQPLEAEDSVVRLAAPFGPGSATTYFDSRPYHSDGDVFQYMESNDIDLGSAGLFLIPGTSRLVAGGKSGILYVLDTETMQATQPPLSAFTGLPLAAGQSLYIYSYSGAPQIVGTPVAWHPDPVGGEPDGVLMYAWPRNDELKSFRYRYDTQTLEPYAVATVPTLQSGGILAFSANGGQSGSGILWASTVSPTAAPAGHLWALDAKTLAVIWDAETPAYAKFAAPTVSGGRVFLPVSTDPVGAVSAVIAYGLSSP